MWQVGQPPTSPSLLPTCFAKVGLWVSKADGLVLKILLLAASSSTLSDPGLGAWLFGRLQTVVRAAAPLRPLSKYGHDFTKVMSFILATDSTCAINMIH